DLTFVSTRVAAFVGGHFWPGCPPRSAIAILLYYFGGRLPRTKLYFYREEDGEAPVLEWLLGLRHNDTRAYAKCVAATRNSPRAATSCAVRWPITSAMGSMSCGCACDG